MTTLDPGDGHLVLINTFTVHPTQADELVELLAAATEEVMRRLPGFVSANLHVSLDHRHVVNYAQWRSREDFDAMQRNPEAQAHMQKAGALSQSFEPVFYELRHAISA